MAKLCWLDIRELGEAREAILEEAIHQRLDAVVARTADQLGGLPPTLTKVLMPAAEPSAEDIEAADVVIVDPRHTEPAAVFRTRHPETGFGEFVEVVDAESLELACQAARTQEWCVLRFRDPTKIPLEIVIAAAAEARGHLVTEAADLEEARIIYGVLEIGSDGVLLGPSAPGDAAALRAAATDSPPDLELAELEVVATEHVGMGERACVDTCTHFREDEGILVGSLSKGLVLCVSETHPLPYMPTRPFRVNAGAIHSYTLATEGRTNYLSELHAGSRLVAVDVKGHTRVVVVGRVKIETRPLLSITAKSADGQEIGLIVQDDWHVRILGPGGAVLNSTELRPGDRILGYLPTESRHVGYPIDEFCLER